MWLDRNLGLKSNTRPYGQVAQSVEQWIENPRVGGSIPSLATNFPLLFATSSAPPQAFSCVPEFVRSLLSFREWPSAFGV